MTNKDVIRKRRRTRDRPIAGQVLYYWDTPDVSRDTRVIGCKSDGHHLILSNTEKWQLYHDI